MTEPALPAIEPGPDRAVTGGGEPCGNCGTIMLGPHCYQCGQPAKGLVRHFSSIMGDLLDTVLQIDTRITRTLSPLLLRPGYLTREYFAGRRVRYVSPVRLFFFLSVLTFLVAQWTLDGQPARIGGNGIMDANSVAEVQKLRDDALQELSASRKQVADIPTASSGLDSAEADIRRQSSTRIAELERAKAAHAPPPQHNKTIEFDGKPWDPVAHPLQYQWLPAFANSWVNRQAARAKDNVQRIQQDPHLLLDAWMSALPSTLFLLLPLFALLLKITYAFKRRLYMEHFIVALHSHAFLCLDLLLILLLNAFAQMVGWSWANTPLLVGRIVLIVWMPIYLLLMQKRVYAQGWLMTLLKYSAIGTVYLVLLSVGAFLSLLAKVVWL